MYTIRKTLFIEQQALINKEKAPIYLDFGAFLVLCH